MTKTMLRLSFAGLAGFAAFSTPQSGCAVPAAAPLVWEQPPCPPPKGEIIVIPKAFEPSGTALLVWEQPPCPPPKGDIIVIPKAIEQTGELPA